VNGPEQLADKQHLRRQLRSERAAFPTAERDRESALITIQVLSLPEIISAQTIHVYLAMRTEVATLPLIRALIASGKQIVVPWMNEDGTMSPSAFHLEDIGGIVEIGKLRVPQAPVLRPVEAGCWDVVVVPLVGATLAGDRIGNGAGHYDRLLTGWPRPSIGVALSVQIVEQLPLEPHDVRLTHLITAPALAANQ
jgi:5-formyltetrahydrofolate cyclo-ligase